MEWSEYQSTVYGDVDNDYIYTFSDISELIKFFEKFKD